MIAIASSHLPKTLSCTTIGDGSEIGRKFYRFVVILLLGADFGSFSSCRSCSNLRHYQDKFD
jgi:hypothetical protein